MENFSTLEASRRPSSQTAFLARFDRRTRLIVLALGGAGAAMYFGWGWLAAAGVTTMIIGLLPCAVMCGLGLCAHRFMGKGGGESCDAKRGDSSSEASAKVFERIAKDADVSGVDARERMSVRPIAHL